MKSKFRAIAFSKCALFAFGVVLLMAHSGAPIGRAIQDNGKGREGSDFELKAVEPISPTEPAPDAVRNAPEIANLNNMNAINWSQGYVGKYTNTTAQMLVFPIQQVGDNEDRFLMAFFDPQLPDKKPGFLAIRSNRAQENSGLAPQITESSEAQMTLETLDGETLAVGSKTSEGSIKWAEPISDARVSVNVRNWNCFSGCLRTIRIGTNCLSFCTTCGTCLKVSRYPPFLAACCAPCVFCAGGTLLACWYNC